MHATLFTLAASPRSLDVSTDELYQRTSDTLLDYISDYSQEYNDTVLNSLPERFGYPEELMQIETETIGKKTFTKVKFLAIAKHLTNEIEKLKKKVKKLKAENYLNTTSVVDLHLDIYYNPALIYDVKLGYTQTFYNWLRDAEREDDIHNTEWFYLGSAFNYHN